MNKRIFRTMLIVFYFALPHSAFTAIPNVNRYRVQLRHYDVEPPIQRFTISAKDENFLVHSNDLFYTELNTFVPKAIYTIPSYPNADALPAIGKWMVHLNINALPFYKRKLPKNNGENQLTYVPAHWISLTDAGGRYIIEPINYLFIVYSRNKTDAISKLSNTLNKIGFSSKDSKYHGASYYAYINHKMFPQAKNKAGYFLAFSNAKTIISQNDHCRVMGPEKINIKNKSAFIFAASISEESGAKKVPSKAEKKLHPNKYWHINLGHHFVSFSHARSNLAIALIQHSFPTYYLVGSNDLNTIGMSTEDHDGKIFITVI